MVVVLRDPVTSQLDQHPAATSLTSTMGRPSPNLRFLTETFRTPQRELLKMYRDVPQHLAAQTARCLCLLRTVCLHVLVVNVSGPVRRWIIAPIIPLTPSSTHFRFGIQ